MSTGLQLDLVLKHFFFQFKALQIWEIQDEENEENAKFGRVRYDFSCFKLNRGNTVLVLYSTNAITQSEHDLGYVPAIRRLRSEWADAQAVLKLHRVVVAITRRCMFFQLSRTATKHSMTNQANFLHLYQIIRSRSHTYK